MAAGCREPVSGKGLRQDFQLRYSAYIDQSPGRQLACIALAAYLVCKQPHEAFLDAVIVRLSDSFFAFVEKPDLTARGDGVSQLAVNIVGNRTWTPNVQPSTFPIARDPALRFGSHGMLAQIPVKQTRWGCKSGFSGTIK